MTAYTAGLKALDPHPVDDLFGDRWAEFDTAPGCREDLAGITEILGVEHRPHFLHGGQIQLSEDQWHIFPLLDADAMLATETPSHGGADAENLCTGLQHSLALVGVAFIEQEQGVQVAIAGVEHVGDTYVIACGDVPDVP